MTKGFLFLLIILPFLAYSQKSSNTYSISGNIKMLVGLEILPSRSPLMVLKETRYIAELDSLGNFKFENLKPGKYRLQESYYLPAQVDTVILIENKSVTGLHFLIKSKCLVTKELAEHDVKTGKPRVLLEGGIAPVYYANQHQFEVKYCVTYEELGDTGPTK